MEEVAPEYDVVVLGTGEFDCPALTGITANPRAGLTECVLSG